MRIIKVADIADVNLWNAVNMRCGTIDSNPGERSPGLFHTILWLNLSYEGQLQSKPGLQA